MKLTYNKIILVTLYIITLSLLAFWGVGHIQKSVNSDVFYLTQSAEHLLDGDNMADSYYDTNPPLSIILQVPAAFMAKYVGIPVYYAISIQTIFFVILSFFLVFKCLIYYQKISWLTYDEIHLIMAVFIVTNTLMVGVEFGQKDQYIAIFLFPFVLLQLLIIQDVHVSVFLKWFTFIISSFFIILKPYYIIVPVIMWAYGLYKHRSISRAFRSPDMWVLGVISLSYVAIIYVFFSDYVTEILPDAITLYASVNYQGAMIKSVYYLFIILAAFIVSILLFPEKQTILLFLFSMSVLSLIPFIIQAKGANYHNIPARLFFMCGFFLLFERLLSVFFSRINMKQYSSLGVLLTIPLLAYWSVSYFVPHLSRMSHEEYKKSKLVDIIKSCKTNNSVFVVDSRSYVISLVPLYAGKMNASRFSALWFLPPILQMKNNVDDGNITVWDSDTLKDKIRYYSDLVAQDISRYRPGVILVSPKSFNFYSNFEFVEFFSENSDAFVNIWKEYALVESVTIDRNSYDAYKNAYDRFETYNLYLHRECLGGIYL